MAQKLSYRIPAVVSGKKEQNVPITFTNLFQLLKAYFEAKKRKADQLTIFFKYEQP